MAQFRGSEGNLSISGNAVGELTGWELNLSRPPIDRTRIGSGAGKVGLNYPRGSGRCTVALDYGDTAQAALFDILVANTEPTAVAAVFTIASGKTITVNILPTSGGINLQREGDIEATFDFSTDSVPVIAWA